MTYLIGDRTIVMNGRSLTEEEEAIFRAHPHMAKQCLNSTTYNYLVSIKNIIHLYCDVVTIYSTLLSKIPNYDDVTVMTNKTRANLTRLEEDLNQIFGKDLHSAAGGWEDKHYEKLVKPLAMLILKSCNESFDIIYKNLTCVDVFFLSFDNLKKLLIPCLLNHTQIIQKLISGAIFLFGLTTIADEVGTITEFDLTAIKQLTKLDSITSGLQREEKLLEMVLSTVNPSLQQYTNILLGKAILKRDIDEAECQIIRRRDVCFQAAEHVVSIPLTSDQNESLSMQSIPQYLFYLISALFVVGIIVLYRFFVVFFG